MSTPVAVTPLPIEDYEAIESAVMETARGRWFLAEYARRNRNSDTDAILGTLERIERQIRRDRAVPDIDRIRLDLADMAEAISRTKQEISQMKLDTEHGGRFSDACHELDAIVGQTEQATNDILMSAEGMQEVAWTLREAGVDDAICDKLDTHATDIYTACSFQDLTGQRTRKVVTVLRYLESRINSMMAIWGLGEADVDEMAPAASPTPPTDTRPDAHLLNGPQLHGRGVVQNDVDDILAEETIHDDDETFDAPAEPAAIVAAEPEPEVAVEPEPIDLVEDLPADVFEMSEADVFATADFAAAAEPEEVEEPHTVTINVGNTLRTVEVAAVAEADTSPALSVVPSEDPVATLEPRRRIVTFG